LRILITNDDGIHAPGLDVCEQIARALSDDVWIVAPETDQSGVSHSLSLNDPLRLREVAPKHFAVKGTPTDCVIMGIRHIIAGAMEGTTLGVPSFALSQGYGLETRGNPHWDTALHHGPKVIRKVLKEGIPPGVLVNVNFPDCAPEAVKGVAITMQGKRDQDLLRIDARHDGRGNPYYWLTFARKERPRPRDGTDLSAMLSKRISVTALRLDLTDEPFMTRLAQVFT
jgi:5'-nucleotidase